MVALRVRVYVEGGGNSRGEQRELKEGFSKLFARALGDRPRPQVIACGGRKDAFDELKKALKSNPDALCILLVDSEAPVRHGASTWDHVRERVGDAWVRPEGTSDQQLHLMASSSSG
jgi:hypothetical protein